MSDAKSEDLVQLSGKSPGEEPAAAASAITLPHTVRLPTRYYARLAVEETVRDFSEISTIETSVGDGVLVVTFKEVDQEAGGDAVIHEFLNHVLYRSATSKEEDLVSR